MVVCKDPEIGSGSGGSHPALEWNSNGDLAVAEPPRWSHHIKVWQTGDVTPCRDDPGSGLFVPASWSAPKMTGQIPARSLIRAFCPGAQPTEDPKSSVVQAGTGNWYPWEGASSFCLPGKTGKIIVHPPLVPRVARPWKRRLVCLVVQSLPHGHSFPFPEDIFSRCLAFPIWGFPSSFHSRSFGLCLQPLQPLAFPSLLQPTSTQVDPWSTLDTHFSLTNHSLFPLIILILD